MPTPYRVPFDSQSLQGFGAVDAGSVLSEVFASQYDTILIETQLLPTIELPLFTPSTGTVGQKADLTARALKPRVTLRGKAGQVSFAPFGEPNTKAAPVAGFLTVMSLLGAGFVLGRISRK